MNISKLTGLTSKNQGASSDEIEVIQKRFGVVLPESYVQLLGEANGLMLESGMSIYSTIDLVERNDTFEVQEYAPGFIAIGDDSGGMCILIRVSTGEVFSVDQGSMDPDDMEQLACNVARWVDLDCQS